MRQVVSIGFAALCALAGRMGAQQPGLEALAWMAGSWAASDGERRTEEHWTGPAGGMMLGLHRDVARGEGSYEFLRIAETPTGVVYLASPQGREPTPFPLVEISAARAVFANPAHDFPQRILYWLEGGDLCAAVEGDQGGETVREQWCWKPGSLASR
jgi:hypothetical protein